MSTLTLGSDLPSLAGRLADVLEHDTGDFFAPVLVVTPNRYVRKWLRLTLARRLGVAINLQFASLEDALWQQLRALDPRYHTAEPEPLDANAYRLLVLSVLLEEREAGIAPLQKYLQLQAQPWSRLSCRRAWHLADRLGALVQEYEYHRQDGLIQPWLRGQSALGAASEFHQAAEQAQRALFGHVTREPDGRRARLNVSSGRRFKTFPQYAMEMMEQLEVRDGPRQRLHVFGLTQISALHARTLAWLGRHSDLRVYHLNVLASRVKGTLRRGVVRAVAEAVREPVAASGSDPGHALLEQWGRAGAESLWLTAELLSGKHFDAEVLPPTPAAPPLPNLKAKRPSLRHPSATVLTRLQDHLLGRPRTAGTAMLPQDTSLQIVACPGIVREVETVYNSILHNLQQYPQLRQTDVGVLVTDMARYRPILQAVFERPPGRLQYNMVDFSAAGLSAMGQALVGMLDLAMESFTRARVFGVLLNPCFLARLGVDRAQALTWLGWAESLGIYQGWDADEKHAQGYARSPLYGWRLGLQRLRLGRFMEIALDDGDQPAPRFGDVIPFADLGSTDREHLDAFCRSVEGLLPLLARLRGTQTSGGRWADTLQRLMHDFLDVPADRPEEEHVRAQLVAAFEGLAHWDHLRDGQGDNGLSLPLVREYVQSQLEALEGSRGEYLVGGVTLAALQPMRPVPFAIVYVLGLGEDLFPGPNQLSSFDLRGASRQHGDIRPAEHGLYQFLEVFLAAKQKLYLLYNSLELQREQPLLPAAPLAQLQRYLGNHITRSEFQSVTMPMRGHDDPFYCAEQQPEHQDVLVQYRDMDRLLTFTAATREGRFQPDLNQRAELAEKQQALQADFTVPAELKKVDTAACTVSITELKRFLTLPCQEALRRHLHVGDDHDRTLADEEPLVTGQEPAYQLFRQALHGLVLRAATGDVDEALAGWGERFAAAYADARLRCQVPDEAFGAIDHDALKAELAERIHGAGELESFLRKRASMIFCGPLLVGESLTPLGAKLRFPALQLRLRHGRLPAECLRETRIVGATPFAWFNDRRFEILVLSNAGKVELRNVTTVLLEPMLLYLALLANSEPNAKNIPSQTWVGKREFQLHVASAAGIATWTLPAGAIHPMEAVQYFTHLLGDFLDPTQYDLLPFPLLASKPELRRVYEDEEFSMGAEEFQQVFQELIDDERDNPFAPLDIPLLATMIGAIVPGDALKKLQRRFGLLDRGPALVRRGLALRGRGRSPTR